MRQASADDADAAGLLTESVYRAGGWAGDEYAKELRDGRSRYEDAVLYVAVRAGAVVGTVTLALPGTRFAETAGTAEGEIRMLAVDPTARRQGIGDALLMACETHGREAGLEALVLSTEPDMHTAHRLYRRRGYLRAPGRDWQVNGFQLLVYRRPL